MDAASSNCGEEREEGREKSIGELQEETNIMEGEMKWDGMTCNPSNASSPLPSPPPPISFTTTPSALATIVQFYPMS
jgi:hypothetical protein